MFSRIRELHATLYFIGLSLMIVSLPLSRFSLSVAQFILVGNWLLELNFQRKWNALIYNTPALVLVSLFVLHVIGLIYTSDIEYAMKDLRIKLPLLALPVIFATTRPLDTRKFNALLLLYTGAVVASTFINFGILLFTDVTDLRQISPFISHIRLSLNICLAIFISGYFAFGGYSPYSRYKIALIILMMWLVGFLIVSQSGTGLYVLFVTTVILLVFGLLRTKNRRLKIFIAVLFGVGVISVSAYLLVTIRNYLCVDQNELKNLPATTAGGNPYTHDTINSYIENGSYIGTWVCEKELREGWNSRSRFSYDGRDNRGFTIKSTLLRYLNSKGLKKDATGIASLDEKDIRNIENSRANIYYTKKISFNARIYRLLWEYQAMKRGANPGGMSVVQRIEYWKAAFSIIADNFWTGVGTGDMDTAFKERYAKMNSRLAPEFQHRSHNQFLAIFVAFGIFGLLWFVATLIYPPVFLKKIFEFRFLAFYIIIILSMLVEDTLETQQGVTLYAFFTSFLLFVHKE